MVLKHLKTSSLEKQHPFGGRLLYPVFAWLLIALNQQALAAPPEVGADLAHVNIDEMGALILLDEEQVSHAPWSSEELIGRPTYMQHLAARASIDGIYKPLSDALEEREYGEDRLNSVAIVNRKDAAWGTGMIVTATLKSNKKRYPEANIVVDTEGKARELWQLQPKQAAIWILDAAGKILFFKEGPLTDDELPNVLKLLDAQVLGAK